ncbi:hypothetical protein A1O1_00467 [Capronia coronata CBS 617.96]|uniref:Uncharacterized protein n=1 Tax=Capronia coronata CBS 617.96 TaxID=1182541 RepID=W9YR64_9EURO|nr:uncharacterized protein A1O1_00467 [Capronia coronata CBS 617.96]EXJ95347.1 hypothetical protein A1O1_00467 [Capronia coronata CBS 617.96]
MPPSTLLRISRSVFSLRTSFRPQSGLRPLSTTPYRFAADQDPDRNTHPQREAQVDRNKLDPEASEYSKSGSDDTAAANEDAAFDPNITDPEEAKQKAGEGNEVNPLEDSPANPEISQGTDEAKGGSKKKPSEDGGGR